jgi:putative pyruvate formate lyase activating enzyme
MKWEAAYLALYRSGELAQRVEQAYARLADCELCGQACHVDRSVRTGACNTGTRALVSSFGPHLGEENPLRGWRGSGTIFFAWCNLKCAFCQNYDISQLGHGKETEPEEIAHMMLELEDQGCHNINFVSPSHVVPMILAAVEIAAARGLHVPLVYNTGGYDSMAALALLDGVIDIYMPDMKYADARTAQQYSKAKDYPTINQAAVKEMHRQVGDLVIDEHGLARRGLLVRHLVMPEGLAGTAEVARFLAQEISPDTYINVMPQYRPAYRAGELPPLDRPLTRQEYEQAVKEVLAAGLYRLDERERSLF